MTIAEELTWRGFVNQTTFKDLAALNKQPLTFYWGVDPSAASMTVGNLAAAMMVKTFMRHGHKAILLVGGATGLVGDPDGKSEERAVKPLEEVRRNAAAIAAQYKQIFGELPFEQVDNYNWFKNMGYLEFLREVGKHVPLRQMLGRDFIQTRLGGSGISYAEFSYVLLQAYDFLYLYTHKQVTLQLCGSDQWGNSIAGVDLIRRIGGGEAHVFSLPIIVNATTGIKFGKSEAGAVWLDEKKTTPDNFYQFWVTTDDASVESYLKVFTELDQSAVEATMMTFQSDPSKRHAQKVLAYEVTKLIHGEAAAKQARLHAETLKHTGPQNIQDGAQDLVVDATASIIDTLVAAALASSKTEARTLLKAGGIYINDQKVDRDVFQDSDFKDGYLRLRRGKTLQNSIVIKRK